jgi:hypothetical protein
MTQAVTVIQKYRNALCAACAVLALCLEPGRQRFRRERHEEEHRHDNETGLGEPFT